MNNNNNNDNNNISVWELAALTVTATTFQHELSPQSPSWSDSETKGKFDLLVRKLQTHI